MLLKKNKVSALTTVSQTLCFQFSKHLPQLHSVSPKDNQLLLFSSAFLIHFCLKKAVPLAKRTTAGICIGTAGILYYVVVK